MAGRQPVLSKSETPPSCACGCGQPVKSHRGVWNHYVQNHQCRGRFKNGVGPARPRKGCAPGQKTSEGAARIAAAARKRMLSKANPMRNKETHRQALEKTLATRRSKIEVKFQAWAAARGLPLVWTSAASLWIGRRNPDFRVKGQRAVIEVTQKECFAGRRKIRTLESYALPTIRHYESKGWRCLVIYLKDHRSTIPGTLLPAIERFVESDWSAVWTYDQLSLYGFYEALW